MEDKNASRGHGTNSGHGHVWSRPDGFRARCGGSIFCDKCKEDEQKFPVS